MYRMSDDTCGHVPGSLARCQTHIGRPYGIRYRIDDEKSGSSGISVAG
jgi:hypothetical protein